MRVERNYSRGWCKLERRGSETAACIERLMGGEGRHDNL